MPISGQSWLASSLRTNSGSLPNRFIGSCIAFIQNRMAKVVCEAVSFLVVMAEPPNATAAASTHSAAG